MATRKSAVFYGLLIALSSIVVGMVIASRLDLAPHSSAADLTIPATNSAPLTGQIDADTFRNIARDAGPAVVSIITTTKRASRDMSSFLEQFGQIFPPGSMPPGGDQPPSEMVPEQAAGSGFIIDAEGYILTNNHVVDGADTIEVRLSTMQDFDEGLPAKIIGHDELTDTALIQLIDLPKEGLTVSRFGDSGQMAPGDWVMAIGNPFGLSNTVTVGIVSAVGRQTPVSAGRYEDFIQTDAAINRGNSGGPLLNLRGEVVGINTMIITGNDLSSGNVGIGFAVPINTVRDLLPQLRTGKVTRGRIGVEISRRPMTEEYARQLGLPNTQGAEVTRVPRGGPAADAGVEVGDVVVEFNGKPIRDNGELVSVVAGTTPGTTVPMVVYRDQKRTTLNVTVGELNLAEEQAAIAPAGRPNGAEPQDTGFGMSIRPLNQETRRQLELPQGRGGALVTSVTPFGPAAQAGITEGDVILSVMGTPVGSVADVTQALGNIGTGRLARIIVWRFANGQGEEMLVQIRKR